MIAKATLHPADQGFYAIFVAQSFRLLDLGKKLFIGTRNAHKISELRAIAGAHTDLLSCLDFPDVQEVDEPHDTLEANAAAKAKGYFAQTGLPCLADDSGLEVEALQGRPGVDTAHYAGPQRNAADNNKRLLAELKDITNRRARFRTVMAWYDGQELRLFEGIVQGHIATEPRGEAGFGYDPVFIPEGYTQSFAELSPEEKNRISHRGRAMALFSAFYHTRS